MNATQASKKKLHKYSTFGNTKKRSVAAST
jgi:hypothetical protein